MEVIDDVGGGHFSSGPDIRKGCGCGAGGPQRVFFQWWELQRDCVRRWRRSEEGSGKPCPIPNCPDHDPDFQLFCSAACDQSSLYALPLIFLEHVRIPSPSPFGLRILHPRSQFSFQAEFGDVTDPILVHYSQVRGVCMVRPSYSQDAVGELTCFVFPGRGTFGHSVVQ